MKININVGVHLRNAEYEIEFGEGSMSVRSYATGVDIYGTPAQLLALADEIYKEHGGVKNERATA